MSISLKSLWYWVFMTLSHGWFSFRDIYSFVRSITLVLTMFRRLWILSDFVITLAWRRWSNSSAICPQRFTSTFVWINIWNVASMISRQFFKNSLILFRRSIASRARRGFSIFIFKSTGREVFWFQELSSSLSRKSFNDDITELAQLSRRLEKLALLRFRSTFARERADIARKEIK